MPGNELHLQDTVRNLKRVVSTSRRIENSETKQTDSYSHECKYILARDGRENPQDAAGRAAARAAGPADARNGERETANNPSPWPNRWGRRWVRPAPRRERRPRRRPARRPPATPSPTRTRPSRRCRRGQVPHAHVLHHQRPTPRTSSMGDGPPEIIAKAKDIVEKLDKPSLDSSRSSSGAVVQDDPGADGQRRTRWPGPVGDLPAVVHAAHHGVGRQLPSRLRLPEEHGRHRAARSARSARASRAC